jgi:hypothetical protein
MTDKRDSSWAEDDGVKSQGSPSNENKTKQAELQNYVMEVT